MNDFRYLQGICGRDPASEHSILSQLGTTALFEATVFIWTVQGACNVT